MPVTSPATPRITLQQHISYICSRLLAYGLPVLLFLVTTSFYLKTYDSAQIKITFTQIGAIALLTVWLVKMLADGKLPFTKADLVYVAPFLAFLASGIIAWLHSPFQAWSLEETMRRIFYMTIALVAIAEIRSSERRTRVWRWLMAAALVAIGYGVIQYLDSRFFPQNQPGIDPFIWRQAFSKRVFSTFGNPNFYGNFLVIMTPLILASVLRDRGPLGRPFLLILVTAGLVFLIDKMQLGLFGGFDPSFRILSAGLIFALLALFVFYSFWGTSKAGSLPLFLILFALLFLNLYSTETKGAWVGFTAALAATVWLIFEYFLHFDEKTVAPKAYGTFLFTLCGLFTALLITMFLAFVLPMIRGSVTQIGFQILWIPTLIAGVIAVVTMVLLARRPWNLKKVIYGFLVFFILAMGAVVLQFSKTRLTSVSFRLFTWISTWEMIRTEPVLGNGVGTFKVIYPAYRRPQIIVLEARSNTETDHAEDEYLEIWQDEGIVGFGIFLWMVILALVLGLKQLRWYSRLRRPEPGAKRKMLEIESDPRSYEVLGFLGAYIGALIHWTFDVSIRFVSSGVYSGLLPGMLVALARNQARSAHSEPLLGYDRWIRAGLAGFWTLVLLWLGVELVPQGLIQGGDTTTGQIRLWAVLAGLVLYAIMEILEIGNTPPQESSFDEEYPARPALFPARLLIAAVILVGCGFVMRFFANHFQADVYHNMGIFFSKEGIWNKSPVYDSRVMSYPPDIREKYQRTGGALEHYAGVSKNNPFFPMAYYFTGNVYNDWGSQEHAAAMTARGQNQINEAERLRSKSTDLWTKAEAAYGDTKKLAPNYVQTHHQVGLLNLKRAEAEMAWGDRDAARKYYEIALANFMRYRLLDPVFPPNYDRIVQILLLQGKTKEAMDLLREGLYYNDVVARSIHEKGFADRIAGFAVSLAKLHFGLVQNEKDPYNPLTPDITEAIRYFKMAADNDPSNIEAWKGLSFLYGKTGRRAEADEAMARAMKLAPNDPGLRTPAVLQAK